MTFPKNIISPFLKVKITILSGQIKTVDTRFEFAGEIFS